MSVVSIRVRTSQRDVQPSGRRSAGWVDRSVSRCSACSAGPRYPMIQSTRPIWDKIDFRMHIGETPEPQVAAQATG
jgi:hypothetical protein